MNTSHRGDKFESQIFELLTQQIVEDKFWARAECCRLFRKKGYFSKDRGKEIVFDISIEIVLPGKTSYSVLVLIECKDYSSRVGVAEVEEFWAKVDQVAGVNVKGIFATTAPFQEGALSFAASKGLAVLRFLRDATFKWELNRSASWTWGASESETSEVMRCLTSESVASRYYDFAFKALDTKTFSSNQMMEALCLHRASAETTLALSALLNPGRHQNPSVPFIEQIQIESLASSCLKGVGYTAGAVDLSMISKKYIDELGLTLRHERSDPSRANVLGTLKFNPLEIYIHSDDPNSGRARFTLAHELGHLTLDHGKHMVKEITEASDLVSDAYTSLTYVDLRRMEWQANFYAACLLLPTQTFVANFFEIARALDLRDKGFGMLYVDDQPVNMASFMKVTGFLSGIFKVSRQAAIIRLKRLGLLNDERQLHISGWEIDTRFDS